MCIVCFPCIKCPKIINEDNKCLKRINVLISILLFACGIAEIIGLFAYHEVFTNVTATGCCGIISDSFDNDNGGYCNEDEFVDGKIEYTVIGGNRICVIGTKQCDRMFDQSGKTLDTCFLNINSTEPAVAGNFNMSDFCSDEAIKYEEDQAGHVALMVIYIGLTVLFCSSLVAIGDFLKYCGCIKCNICKCLTCTCCCTEGCSIYAQLIFWLYLFVCTMVYVEDTTDEGYIMMPHLSNELLSGYPVASVAKAAADNCDIDGFLWMDYHIEKVPDIVASRDYEIVSTIGLVFSIIEFAIGIALVHCKKKKQKGTENSTSESSI